MPSSEAKRERGRDRERERENENIMPTGEACLQHGGGSTSRLHAPSSASLLQDVAAQRGKWQQERANAALARDAREKSKASSFRITTRCNAASAHVPLQQFERTVAQGSQRDDTAETLLVLLLFAASPEASPPVVSAAILRAEFVLWCFAQCGRPPCLQKQLSEQRLSHEAPLFHAGDRRYCHFLKWLQQKSALQFAPPHQCSKGSLISFVGEEHLAWLYPLHQGLFCLRQNELLQRSGTSGLRCLWHVQVRQSCFFLEDSIRPSFEDVMQGLPRLFRSRQSLSLDLLCVLPRCLCLCFRDHAIPSHDISEVCRGLEPGMRAAPPQLLSQSGVSLTATETARKLSIASSPCSCS